MESNKQLPISSVTSITGCMFDKGVSFEDEVRDEEIGVENSTGTNVEISIGVVSSVTDNDSTIRSELPRSIPNPN